MTQMTDGPEEGTRQAADSGSERALRDADARIDSCYARVMTIAADAELHTAIARRRASGDDSNDAFLIEEIVGRHGEPIAGAARLLELPRTTVVRRAQERAREVRATIALLPEGPPEPRAPLEVRERRLDEARHRRYLVGVVKNLVAALAAGEADGS